MFINHLELTSDPSDYYLKDPYQCDCCADPRCEDFDSALDEYISRFFDYSLHFCDKCERELGKIVNKKQ